MKHKVGDVVTTKSLDWYNEIKYEQIASLAGKKLPLFAPAMTEYCGMQAKISSISGHIYKIDIDCGLWDWADYMFEEGIRLIKKKNPKEPIVISKNYILSDKLTSIEELDELSKNEECVAWRHSDNNTYTIWSASFFMNWSYRILKTRLNNMYKVIRNDKANMIVEALAKENIIYGENIKKAIDITRKILNKNE